MQFDLSGASFHVGETEIGESPLVTYGGGSGSNGQQQQDWLEAAREQERKRFAKRTRGGDEPEEEDERQTKRSRAEDVTLDDEKKRFIAEIKTLPLGITRTGGAENTQDSIDELASTDGRTAYLERHGYLHLTEAQAHDLRQLRERIQEWANLLRDFREREYDSQKQQFLIALKTWRRDGLSRINVPEFLEERGFNRLTFTEILTWPEYQEWRRAHYTAKTRRDLFFYDWIVDHWPPEPADIASVLHMGSNAFSAEDAKQLILGERQRRGLTSTEAAQPIRGDARVPDPGSSTTGIGGRFHAHKNCKC